MYILGISGGYHDAAAALLKNDNLLAAAQEERFTRIKHDPGFPANSIRYCLEQAGIRMDQVDRVVFYDSPSLKFKRIARTILDNFPRSIPFSFRVLPKWLGGELYWKRRLCDEFRAHFGCEIAKERISNICHHRSHAASAFYPSPFSDAAVLVMDGVGEFATTSIWHGQGKSLTQIMQVEFPHSLGLLYSAFTYYTGFKVNSGEYKVMGLAPYGSPRYVALIKEKLIDIREDGTFRLNMEYFDYAIGSKMTSEKFHDLFGGPPRKPESELTQREMDLARSVQEVTEEIMLRLAQTAKQATGSANLCLAGGVALNCVGNGRILQQKIFERIWIQPAAGDAGGSVGAAMDYYYAERAAERYAGPVAGDRMKGSYLGPQFGNESVRTTLSALKATFHQYDELEQLLDVASTALAEGKVVGWHQGRMEFGPRALGARSILGDPRNPQMQSVMNLKIKQRESFRPFAPSVLQEKARDYFELAEDSPYMLIVAPIVADLRIPMTAEHERLFGIEKLNIPRSTIPAVTHIDYSARVQTVHRETNPRYHRLIEKFFEKTGCAVIVNTSFNVRGEPIVCTPEDSYRCFMRTEMDVLVLEDFVIYKNEQKNYVETDEKWRSKFVLD
jgi:carbamoyltransferase